MSYTPEEKRVAAKPDVVGEEEMPVQTVHGLVGHRRRDRPESRLCYFRAVRLRIN